MEHKPDDPNHYLSLYDRLGGWILISITMDKFCDRLLADPKWAGLLGRVSPEVLKKMTAEYAADLLGETKRYTGPPLAALREQAAITQALFDRAISHLIAALVWTGASRVLIEEVLNVVTPLSAQLVTASDTRAGAACPEPHILTRQRTPPGPGGRL